MSVVPLDPVVAIESPAESSLAHQAYLQIRERILRGLLRPGEALSRRQLAEEFGVSLLPVSEALKQLESDKLVESRPRAGTRVRIPSQAEVRGRCVVREALESQSARLCSSHASMRDALSCRAWPNSWIRFYGRFQHDDDMELQWVVHTNHFELHMRVAEYARCPELKEAIEMNQVLIYNWFFDLAAERRSLPPGFHSLLMKAVTGKDPLAADQAMRSHVQHGMNDTLQRVGSKPDKSDWRLRR